MKRILWKVVNEDRKSISVSDSKKFSLRYKKGKIVKAKRNSLGIFCFKTKVEALVFSELSHHLFNSYSILRVLPQERGRKPKIISSKITERRITLFYDSINRYNNYMFSCAPPCGTICYPSVLVLD